MKKQLAILAAAVFLTSGGAFAQDTNQDHSKHHPEEQTTGEPAKAPQQGSMMDSMKMDDMKGAMHECMEMHKDGKMCEHDAMAKCEGHMKKADCQKMMKQTKTQEKKEKVKK